MSKVTIIGGGLAGSEAAWQLAERGVAVELFEMRPERMTRAHKTGRMAELVCSNSFRGAALSNAVGLLKEELRRWGSIVMQAADHAQVPAGGALAVDRDVFSAYVDEHVRGHKLVTVSEKEITEIPNASRECPVIVATGPLTSEAMSRAIRALTGQEHLAFYDAISPIILDESINHDVIFRQSRYDKGEGSDYLNIPLSREEYYAFVEAMQAAEKYTGHEEVEADAPDNLRPFEGCMPIEDMVERGPETLRFGPFKPVGLADPRTGQRPYAVAQLRQDNKEASLWSMVGMQTRMKQGEQLRVFRSLPGLEQAEFVRLGSVHRNTFINSPTCLNPTLEFRTTPGLFFAGQITGSEGYVESTAGGLLAGVNAARLSSGAEPLTLPNTTALGALMAYISDPERKDFQPMNINFGLMPGYTQMAERRIGAKRLPKKERRENAAEAALQITEQLVANVM